ncbi:hypothetical protein DFP72DRAFT_882319 [Ephemerocybe angulata]|uniref:NACHT domain-containing protein n=1 Tax=Ephemerocybe angulata TaxID=980116 RepID=A0A8H6IAW3_9AGAR|nr:hypothetical protein DFP72DRAFT_882319 [Tulosesus angulatus]
MEAFDSAHDFSIAHMNTANTIYDQRTYVRAHPTSPVDALRLLQKARAVEATHTSKTAAYAPKCKPGSRAQVIQDLMDWVATASSLEEPAMTERVLWFQGPAGGGKTCIMRELASRCQTAGLLAATYFFSTRVPGLNIERPFVATIVHQLITTMPRLRPHVLQEIVNNDVIFEESLDTQVETLILRPLGMVPPRKMAIIIDGFDECQDPKERGHLLQILRTLAIPFTVVIASRPEFDIRTAFSSPDLKVATRFLRLQDYDGTTDILNFLCDGFHIIRETHPTKDSIPESWPAETIINTLVEKSSGSYVYPATVMKYIDNPRRHPITLLEEVLDVTPRPSKRNPLAELDALYAHILHPPDTDLSLMKDILHCTMSFAGADVTGKRPYELHHETVKINSSPTFLDKLLNLRPGTTNMTLCDLHSLLSVPDDSDWGSRITIHHKTLEDYLVSEERSGDMYQALATTRLSLASICAHHLERWLEFPEATNQHHYRSVASYSYSTMGRYLEQVIRTVDPGVVGLTLATLGVLWKYGIAYGDRYGDSGLVGTVPWFVGHCKAFYEQMDHHNPDGTPCFRCVVDRFREREGLNVVAFVQRHQKQEGEAWSSNKIREVFAKFDAEILRVPSPQVVSSGLGMNESLLGEGLQSKGDTTLENWQPLTPESASAPQLPSSPPSLPLATLFQTRPTPGSESVSPPPSLTSISFEPLFPPLSSSPPTGEYPADTVTSLNRSANITTTTVTSTAPESNSPFRWPGALSNPQSAAPGPSKRGGSMSRRKRFLDWVKKSF